MPTAWQEEYAIVGKRTLSSISRSLSLGLQQVVHLGQFLLRLKYLADLECIHRVQYPRVQKEALMGKSRKAFTDTPNYGHDDGQASTSN